MGGWTHYESGTIKTNPSRVWAIWSDVPKWSEWDVDMASSHLVNPDAGFVDGAKGSVTMKWNQTAEIVLGDVVRNVRFFYRVHVPLCTMDFTFEMTYNKDHFPNDSAVGDIELKHGAVYTGLLGNFFGWYFKQTTVHGLAAAVQNIKRMTEGASSS